MERYAAYTIWRQTCGVLKWGCMALRACYHRTVRWICIALRVRVEIAQTKTKWEQRKNEERKRRSKSYGAVMTYTVWAFCLHSENGCMQGSSCSMRWYSLLRTEVGAQYASPVLFRAQQECAQLSTKEEETRNILSATYQKERSQAEAYKQWMNE